MRPAPSPSAWRKFRRGLTHTCLLLLLPVQLALLWLARLDQPARLPDFLANFVTARLADQGVDARARGVWILPDLTLAVDDLSVGVAGLSGELLTATRVEIALSPSWLLAGQIEPTRVRFDGGSLWCPASVARDGKRRMLIADLTFDVSREGRWVNLRVLQARGGKITFHLAGEAPVGLLGLDAGGWTFPAGRSLADALARLEAAVDFAGQSGGASLSLRCAGRSDGGAEITGQALLGDDWSDASLGRIQARGLEARGALTLTADGGVGAWRWSAEGRDIAWREHTAGRVSLRGQGLGSREGFGADIVGTDLRLADVALTRMAVQVRAGPAGTTLLTYRVQSPASTLRGSAAIDRPGEITVTLAQANLAGAEIGAHPMVGPLLRRGEADLRGEVLIRDAVATLSPDGEIRRASGELAAAGFHALGLSAETVAPARTLPFRTHFDFDPARSTDPLRLDDLRLGTVGGTLACEPRIGGAFRLHLSGEVAPASLDRLLGEWWVSLWRLFVVRENPSAFIEVESRWGALTSVTRGRVRLDRFDFLGAPFRGVEISVEADAARTSIGLHRLAGGVAPTDGSVDGTAVWDWSKPAALAGPVVRLEGDLQPWVAARCAGREFGDALRGLSLPAQRRLTLLLTPNGRSLDAQATLDCAGDFVAWGIAGHDLKLKTTTEAEGMRIGAVLGLAGGTADLELRGDPLRVTQVKVGLRACDPVRLVALRPSAAPLRTQAGPAAPSSGRLDLDFTGEIDLTRPLQLKGKGEYALTDPELKKIRLFGGISEVLEVLGVGLTTYELNRVVGRFGCLGGRAYLPDVAVTGPQARLDFAGEIDLVADVLNFEGNFSVPRKPGFNPFDIINLNRAFSRLWEIKIGGAVSQPEIRAFPTLESIVKPQPASDLGKLPESL